MTRGKQSKKIDQEAAQWVVRQDSGALSGDATQSFDAWMAADARHRGAYYRACAIFLHYDRAAALGPDFNPESFVRKSQLFSSQSSRRRAFLGGAAAASIAIAVGLGFNFRTVRYETKVGELRTIVLSDGSVVTLNTASSVEVSYSQDHRNIRLVEGEVFFDVAKDANRPFIVMADATEVHAIGTSFLVRAVDRKLSHVLVRHGVVDVSCSAAGQRQSIRVPENTKVVSGIDASGEISLNGEAIAADEIDQALIWREGMISLDNTSLRDAASEFGRYSDVRIVIDDPSVAALLVTGMFSVHNPEDFANAVGSSFGLKVEAGSREVTIKR
tara:strand:- start:749 stop:1735 length:987 start_codon:yes stop_codon:yes gene_type:complete